FRGGHFTLLAFGAHAIAATQAFDSHGKRCLRAFAVRPAHTNDDRDGLVDEAGQACEAYGVSAEENIIFLVRPDGYVGLVAVDDFAVAIERYLARVTGAYGQINGRDMQTTRAIAH
ncbi:FAD-binding monooxygenase, partial [Pseudomonas syringae]|nr:FAD-binding monooxygenase [Pseudomonas syringae]